MAAQIPLPVGGGPVPLNEYLRFVPLRYPRIIRQTEASARLHLYGNQEDPAYRDQSPRDGVDDERGQWLTALAARFAPIMVRNSSQFPIDFRAFYDRGSFPIFLERWDVARATFSLVDSETVDMANTATNPCPAGGAGENDDCRLLELIERFGPDRAPLEPEATAPAEREIFSVMHFDLPGFDEKTWKAEYGERHRSEFSSAARVFAHPFVSEVPSTTGGEAGYEFVIQYWFFYPANDGPNNHEGDWEHINAVIAPLSSVERSLDAAGIERLVSASTPLEGPDPLVLKRVEYFLHHFVVNLDFSSPNAYQPRPDWDREVRALTSGRGLNRRVYDRVRERAWRDAAETTINTRPIVWIGGDGIGIQNVLETPGLKDRDGHASYPFRGYYKRIGPGFVGERVIEAFDHFEYFARPAGNWRMIEDYGDPAKIALTPDWENVLEPVRADPTARRNWSWLTLPLRFGYPASPSPGAGLVAHADMGNVSVVGPAYNDGWNRVGDSAGYERYELVETSWTTPLGVTDSFFPRLGFLNAPVLYFMIKPPLDLAWRTLALPVRAVVGTRQPTFLPASAPNIRSVSVEVGPMLTDLNDDLIALFFSREQFLPILLKIVENLPEDASTEAKGHFGWATAPAYSLVFHLSPRFSAESSLISYAAQVGFDVTTAGVAEPIRVRADFKQFEFHGSTRFNLLTGNVQPYVTYGNGMTWYQLKNVNVNGQLVSPADSPKFRPSGSWLGLGFNETILGAGIDWNRIRVGRAWLGAKFSYSWIHHDLGFERSADVERFPPLATAVAGTTYAIWRQQMRALLSVSF